MTIYFADEIRCKNGSLLLDAPALLLCPRPIFPASVESSCLGGLLLKASASEIDGAGALLTIC